MRGVGAPAGLQGMQRSGRGRTERVTAGAGKVRQTARLRPRARGGPASARADRAERHHKDDRVDLVARARRRAHPGPDSELGRAGDPEPRGQELRGRGESPGRVAHGLHGDLRLAAGHVQARALHLELGLDDAVCVVLAQRVVQRDAACDLHVRLCIRQRRAGRDLQRDVLAPAPEDPRLVVARGVVVHVVCKSDGGEPVLDVDGLLERALYHRARDEAVVVDVFGRETVADGEEPGREPHERRPVPAEHVRGVVTHPGPRDVPQERVGVCAGRGFQLPLQRNCVQREEPDHVERVVDCAPKVDHGLRHVVERGRRVREAHPRVHVPAREHGASGLCHLAPLDGDQRDIDVDLQDRVCSVVQGPRQVQVGQGVRDCLERDRGNRAYLGHPCAHVDDREAEVVQRSDQVELAQLRQQARVVGRRELLARERCGLQELDRGFREAPASVPERGRDADRELQEVALRRDAQRLEEEFGGHVHDQVVQGHEAREDLLRNRDCAVHRDLDEWPPLRVIMHDVLGGEPARVQVHHVEQRREAYERKHRCEEVHGVRHGRDKNVDKVLEERGEQRDPAVHDGGGSEPSEGGILPGRPQRDDDEEGDKVEEQAEEIEDNERAGPDRHDGEGIQQCPRGRVGRPPGELKRRR